MIRLVFALVICSVTLADITWKGGENMVWWTLRQKFSLKNSSHATSSDMATRAAIYKVYAFLVYPRSWLNHVPITLVQMKLTGKEHRQHPFPSLEMQEIGNCSALQDVSDIFIDTKGLLWVLDAGFSYTSTRQPCKPKILAFNVATRKVVKTIDMSDFEDKPLYSHIVVDYNQQGYAFVYVSDIMNRKIHVISGPSCHQTISLPDSSIIYSSTVDITLNLVRNATNTIKQAGEECRVLINDERGEKMFFLRLEDARVCSEEDYPLYCMGPSKAVILGNDHRSVVYYREKSNTRGIYKYDVSNARVRATVAYVGNYSAVPRQVVPGYKWRETYLLESKTTVENSVTVVTHSLKLI